MRLSLRHVDSCSMSLIYKEKERLAKGYPIRYLLKIDTRRVSRSKAIMP